MFETQEFVVPNQGTTVWEKGSVTVFITVSLNTMPYILVLRYQHFGETYYLYHQGTFTLKMEVAYFSAVPLPV
jgi:hypothetical protein